MPEPTGWKFCGRYFCYEHHGMVGEDLMENCEYADSYETPCRVIALFYEDPALIDGDGCANQS